MAGSQALGFVFAIISATMNGSFTSVSKMKRVADADLDPILFNFYVCLGVFASSWLVCPFLPLAGAPFSMAAPALIAGATFVFATLFSFLAIPLVGIAIGQGERDGRGRREGGWDRLALG